MNSSPKILKTVKVIHTEVSLKEMYENSILYPEMKKWLYEKKFKLKIEALPWPDMGNVLFIRDEKNKLP